MRILDELDADRVDLALGFFSRGQVHHKQRLLYRDSYVVLFNAELVGLTAPIGLEDYLRFPHVLTSLRETAHGVVDDALALIGRARVLAVTTPRFLVVPSLVRAAPLLATMHARLATSFAGALGLSTSPVPVPSTTWPCRCSGMPHTTTIPPIAGCGTFSFTSPESPPSRRNENRRHL